MAAIYCDMCQAEPTVLLQTNMGNGDTVGVGQSCLLPFALGLATTFSEGAEKEEQDIYADAVAALLANLAPSMRALAKSAVPKPHRRRKTADKTGHDDSSAEEARQDVLDGDPTVTDLRERDVSGQPA